MKKIEYFELLGGKEPFREWFVKLEAVIQQRIDAYLKRVASGGGKKNIRSLKDGVFEIKMDFGPGYRVYFGEESGTIILLLLGGDKRAQLTDILTAKKYWREYVQKKSI